MINFAITKNPWLLTAFNYMYFSHKSSSFFLKASCVIFSSRCPLKVYFSENRGGVKLTNFHSPILVLQHWWSKALPPELLCYWWAILIEVTNSLGIIGIHRMWESCSVKFFFSSLTSEIRIPNSLLALSWIFCIAFVHLKSKKVCWCNFFHEEVSSYVAVVHNKHLFSSVYVWKTISSGEMDCRGWRWLSLSSFVCSSGDRWNAMQLMPWKIVLSISSCPVGLVAVKLSRHNISLRVMQRMSRVPEGMRHEARGLGLLKLTGKIKQSQSFACHCLHLESSNMKDLALWNLGI